MTLAIHRIRAAGSLTTFSRSERQLSSERGAERDEKIEDGNIGARSKEGGAPMTFNELSRRLRLNRKEK